MGNPSEVIMMNGTINSTDDQHIMKISKNLIDCLRTGTLHEQRMKDNESKWTEKISRLDQSFSAEEKLDSTELERLFKSVGQYIDKDGTAKKNCSIMKNHVTNCLDAHYYEPLKCEGAIKDFINCVDNALFVATRFVSGDDFRILLSKKLTYTERFERGY